MAYDFDSLYSEAFAGVFASAKKRFYDNRVLSITSGEESGKFAVRGSVSGRRDYKASITFDESGGLYDYSCDCDSYSLADGPCKHIVALALAYEDRFPQSAPAAKSTLRERTDAAALTLSSEYSKRRHTRFLASEEEKVRLVPILQTQDNDRLSLRFMIGRNKLYTLKDISDFVSAVQSLGYRRYGVELELEHNPNNFDDKSKELISFLTASYIEKTELSKDAAVLPGKRDEIMLIANDVDEFIAMFSGRLVQFDDKNVRSGVRLIVADLNSIDSKLVAEKVNGGFILTSTMPQFCTVNGKKFSYYITDSRIFTVSKEYNNVLSPLLKTLNINKKLYIADADMPFFYNNVLASVGQFITTDAGDFDLSVFEAVPFKAKIFLNGGAGGSIKAALECSYDDEIINIFDDSYISDIVRDWDAEREFKNVISKYFPAYPNFELYDDFDIYNLMSAGVSELFNFADVFLEENVRKMKVKRPPRVKVGVRIESDLLKIDLGAEEYTFDEMREILNAYREKKNYVRLCDGSFVDLIDPTIRSLSEILEITDTDRQNFTLPKFYAPYLNSMLKEGFFSLERDSGFKMLIKNLSDVSDLDISVPEELKNVMRNYQKTGFRWLKTLSQYGFGGILADDMGLGKSLQIIALIKSEGKGTSIIVCPTTLILNWISEFEKFAPSLKVLAVMGSFEERKAKIERAGEFDVVVTSYELMRRDEEFYAGYKFNYAVVDEAQYIKNPETRNAQSVKRLAASHRFALTGTPVENSLAELWSIFDFIMPHYLYSYDKFKDKFESDIVRGSDEAAGKLRKLVAPFIMRRLKSTVLTELPPKTETEISAAFEGEQKKLYLANLSLIKDSVRAAGPNVNKVVVLSMLTKLRQICCEPRLAYPDYAGNSAKLETCMELLTEAVASGHKVLLFSQFTSMLDIVRSQLAEKGITYYLLKGDTPKPERMRLVNRFNNNETNVFLISLKAGGTGLNLTGADVVIHYDPWWNESVMNQATDRAYRMGQDKPVQVYKLILKDSIEERILALQKKKTALGSLVVGKTQTQTNLSYEDILAILE